MKKSIFLFAITILFFSCKSHEKNKEVLIEKKDKIELEDPNEELEIEASVHFVEFSNTLITLNKTECSGDCPVFEISISKDSVLTYKGIKYVSVIGEKEIKLTKDQYKSIQIAIDSTDFKNLNENYLGDGDIDFSNTIIAHDGKNVAVRLWKNAPKKLTNLYVILEDILYDNKFLEE